MLYLVTVKAEMGRANEVDRGRGPGPIFDKIKERFHPQSFWGNPTRRQLIMVVDLEGPAEITELMYLLTWSTGAEPEFTPLMTPEEYDRAMADAKKTMVPP